MMKTFFRSSLLSKHKYSSRLRPPEQHNRCSKGLKALLHSENSGYQRQLQYNGTMQTLNNPSFVATTIEYN